MKSKFFLFASIFLFFASISCTSQEITAKQILKNISKGKSVVVKNKTIVGALDLTDLKGVELSKGVYVVEIASDIVFVNCEFKDPVNFFSVADNGVKFVQFSGNVSFVNCKFLNDVNFQQAEFFRTFRFQHNTVQGDFLAPGAKFYAFYNYFNENEFSSAFKLVSSYFAGNVNFMDNKFGGYADFTNVGTDGLINMSNSVFDSKLIFANAKLESLWLNYAVLNDKFYMSDAHVDNSLRFLNARFKQDMVIRNTTIWGELNFSGVQQDSSASFNLDSVLAIKAFLPQQDLAGLNLYFIKTRKYNH